jgi:hypothetical protein
MTKTVGTILNYSELEGTNPTGQIEARYSGISGKYYVKTKLELKGRGITFSMKYDQSNCNNPNKYGYNIYFVTKAAYARLEKQYLIVQELLLD